MEKQSVPVEDISKLDDVVNGVNSEQNPTNEVDFDESYGGSK